MRKKEKTTFGDTYRRQLLALVTHAKKRKKKGKRNRNLDIIKKESDGLRILV